jgi:hypothetical protein
MLIQDFTKIQRLDVISRLVFEHNYNEHHTREFI